MLPKKARLTAAEVREILKSGRSVRSATLSAKYLPDSAPKAAIVVSSKVARSAVERNRLRRLGYQALQGILPKARIVVFLHKPQLNPSELAQLCSKLS